MAELKTKPSAAHLRTPKAKRKLGLFVPTVHLPHDYLIQSNHLPQSPLSNRQVANLPPGRSDPSQADITESGIPEKGVRDSAAPSVVDELGTPETGVPESGTRAIQTARPRQIRRAVLAQDGHSLGEQALYEALWQAARRQSHQARLISIGYRGMAELARLTVNNCKANIKALANKLAVEEISSYTHAHARSYLIYSFSAILERRKAAGLTHYVKTRGVQFVDPESGKALSHPRAHRDTRCTPEPG